MMRLAFNHGSWDPTYGELVRLFRCISSTDQENALKFVYRRDVKSYLAARLLTIFVAKHCLGLDPVEVTVERDPNDRPGLSNKPDFDFNLSHNGDFTVLTSCHKMRTGVDVMRVELPPASSSVNEFLHKMRSLFAPSEWYSLNNPVLGANDRMRRFYRFWCLKEAFVKNTGTGLRVNVSTVQFDLTATNPKCTHPGLVDGEWVFEEHQLPNNHVAAVSWHMPGAQELSIAYEPFRELSFNQLLEDLNPWNDVSETFWPTYCSKELIPPSSRTQLV
uniref:L-aminoadipate-semialdehyde dehydrogenase-phosphopantetheinyl transferase n=1 Tax=Mesocestoides corti TaxID=53468 RepID=A0A5K3EVM3_MESCO